MILSGSKIYTTLAILLAIGLLGLSNCKPPEEPFDDSTETAFELKGTIDGKPLQLIAGVNGYYMFTDYEFTSTDSIYRFKARIDNDSCINCEAIEIIIGDDDKSFVAGSIDIETALTKTIIIQDPSQVLNKIYSLNFIAKDSGFASPQYSWRFDLTNPSDSTIQPNPVQNFTDTAAKNICLTVRDGGCTRTICNVFKPFRVDEGDSIPPAFDYVLGETARFINTSFGLSYLWEFGDGTTSVAYNPEHLYASPGLYTVCLTVTTVANTHKYCKLVNINHPFFSCIANMEYGKPSVVSTPENFISKTIIRYTAENGDIYESNSAKQPAGSFFNILSNRSYLLNEKGEKTQQVNLTFKCRVFNTNNSSDFKDLEITDGVIAVAHP